MLRLVGGEPNLQREFVAQVENRLIDFIARERVRMRAQVGEELQRQMDALKLKHLEKAEGVQEPPNEQKGKTMNEEENGKGKEGSSNRQEGAKRHPQGGSDEKLTGKKRARSLPRESDGSKVHISASPQTTGSGYTVIASPGDDPYYHEDCESGLDLSYDIDEPPEEGSQAVSLWRQRQATEQHLQFLGINVDEKDGGEKQLQPKGVGRCLPDQEVLPKGGKPVCAKGDLRRRKRAGDCLPST